MSVLGCLELKFSPLEAPDLVRKKLQEERRVKKKKNQNRTHKAEILFLATFIGGSL